MPKKNMTPEEKKAWAEKMKAAKAAKQEVKEEAKPSAEQDILDDDYKSLLKRINELESKLKDEVKTNSQPEVNNRGRLIGTYEKYVIDPNYYPDPREKLSQEPRLQRFAFPLNYELGWDIHTVSYESIDGVRVSEPRFHLELHRIVMDEDGNPTNGRYKLKQLSLHEDPDAAIAVARENGIDVDKINQKQFLDDMRYLRIRDWLIEKFYPSTRNTSKQTRQMVVDNQVVEFFEVTSDDAQSFKELNKR